MALLDFFRAWSIQVLISTWVSSTRADVIAYDRFNGSVTFEDMEANFGPAVEEGGMLGVLVRAVPYNGCKILSPPPYVPGDGDTENITLASYALIKRGDCDFGQKVLNAQKAGYRAAIVHNVDSDVLVRMSSQSASITNQIMIPSVFIGQNSATILNTSYLYDKDGHPYVQLYENEFNPLEYYLVPFVIVISVCFISLLCFLIIKCVRDRQRARRGRLSLQRLKKLPVKKYDKGDEYDVCAICLDDYDEGDTLRILPCEHAYHCKCVDPWLTSSKRICPLCKRRVLSDDESSSSSEEDDSSDDERTPLTATSAASSANAARYGTGFASRNPLSRRHIRNTSVASDTSGDTTITDVSEEENAVTVIRTRRVAPQKNIVTPVTEGQPHSSGYQPQTLCGTQGVASVEAVENPAMASDDYLDSAEAYMGGQNRVSESSITVLSDIEASGSTPGAHSCCSQDFHSFEENPILNTPPDRTEQRRHDDASASDHDDIMVIASGSKLCVRDDFSEA